MAPSHYLNQCWNIVDWTLENKLQWNFNRNIKIFIHENVFENIVCVWYMPSTYVRGRVYCDHTTLRSAVWWFAFGSGSSCVCWLVNLHVILFQGMFRLCRLLQIKNRSDVYAYLHFIYCTKETCHIYFSTWPVKLYFLNPIVACMSQP